MNLNIFKRIADLEEQVLRLRGGQSAQLNKLTHLLDKFAQPKRAKQTDADKIEKRRAYARKYYAKKKAAKAAA
jgi:hypothetical protein